MKLKKILDYALGTLTLPFVILGFLAGIAYWRFSDGLEVAAAARDPRFWE